MSRCEEHDVNEWACVIHPRTGQLTHFKRPWPGCRLDFTGSSLHGVHDPLPRPLPEHCRPGHCLALTCCSNECAQGRCPSTPTSKEPTP